MRFTERGESLLGGLVVITLYCGKAMRNIEAKKAKVQSNAL